MKVKFKARGPHETVYDDCRNCCLQNVDSCDTEGRDCCGGYFVTADDNDPDAFDIDGPIKPTIAKRVDALREQAYQILRDADKQNLDLDPELTRVLDAIDHVREVIKERNQ